MANELLHQDRLFPIAGPAGEIARELYRATKDLQIISPHGHCDPRWIAEDEPFTDDTLAFMTIPVRHEVARRIGCTYLAGLVLKHRLSMNDEFEVAHDLTYGLPRKAYRVDG